MREFDLEMFLVEGEKDGKKISGYFTPEEIYEAMSVYMETRADEEIADNIDNDDQFDSVG